MLGVLLSLALSVSPLPSEMGPVYSPPWMGELTALLEFLPASGQGVVAGDDTMCDNPALTPFLTGAYACLNGDGTSVASAGMGLSVVGAPTADIRPVCSNGLDCTSRTSRRTTTSDRWVTTLTPPEPSGNWWVCWGGTIDVLSSYVAARFGGTTDAQVFALGTSTSGSVSFNLQRTSDNGTFSASTPGAAFAGAPQVYCATYQRVGEGTSIARVYVDGVLKTTKSDMPLTRQSTINYAFSAGSLGFNATKGRTGFAVVGEGLPSDADMAAIARAFLGTLAGTKSEVLTLSRNTVSTCCRDDGTGCVVLPPGRACWAGGRLKVRPLAANMLGQSSAFDVSATWAPFGGGLSPAPTVAADAAINRSGTRTADLLALPDTSGASDFSGIQQGLSGSAGAYTCFVDAMAQSGTPTLQIILKGTAPAVQNCVLSPSNITRCTVSAASTTPTFFAIGNDRRSAGTPQGAFGAYISNAQCTATNTPRDYCPTGAAPASCAEEVPTFQTAGWWPDAQGCAAATIVPRVAGNYMKVLWVGSDVLFAHINTGGPLAFNTWDGTTTVGGTLIPGDPLNKPARAVVEWSGSTLSLTVNGTKTTGAFDGSWNSNGNLRLGRGDGGVPWWGDIYNVVVGNKPGACQ